VKAGSTRAARGWLGRARPSSVERLAPASPRVAALTDSFLLARARRSALDLVAAASAAAAAASISLLMRASAASAARAALSFSPRISSRKRLGMEGRALPHFERDLHMLSVSVSSARVTPT
jgi:hypothetical protein